MKRPKWGKLHCQAISNQNAVQIRNGKLLFTKLATMTIWTDREEKFAGRLQTKDRESTTCQQLCVHKYSTRKHETTLFFEFCVSRFSKVLFTIMTKPTEKFHYSGIRSFTKYDCGSGENVEKGEKGAESGRFLESIVIGKASVRRA